MHEKLKNLSNHFWSNFVPESIGSNNENLEECHAQGKIYVNTELMEFQMA